MAPRPHRSRRRPRRRDPHHARWPGLAVVLVAALVGACTGATSKGSAGVAKSSPAARTAPTSTLTPTLPAMTAGPATGTAGPATATTTTTPGPATGTAGPATAGRSTTTTVRPTSTTTVAAAAPGSFTGTVATITAAGVPSTWRAGCPVGPAQLRLLHLSYWGFDNQAHVGTMVVNAAVVSDVLKILSTLFAEHFPIYQMQPEDAYGGSDPASMAADNTSGFNCRLAVVPPGQKASWSVHAFGEAIDVNTVQNPYVEGGTVMPAAGATYVDRANVRPGMAVPGGELVRAFAAAGWQWGGRWTDTPDYQHFSKTGG